ncbi:MAG TPA: PTS transporter subunit EIIA [Firmicutes bacterium]|nr:PTS transporter subunit EIIA [Candidatus Fermentithermobacillaceae bacterium]
MKLCEVLRKDHIALKVPARDWAEAVTEAGCLLVRTGAVESRYVPAMLGVIKELGPYVVIAPGVAMPHARPEDGVNETSLGIVTLVRPVDFGNPANDPVDIVIPLAAKDHDTHIDVLKELASFLGNEENVRALREARTADEVLDLISKGTD